MKKLITLFIALTLGLSACGDSSNVTNDGPDNNPPIGDDNNDGGDDQVDQETTDDPREFIKLLFDQEKVYEITLDFDQYVKNTWNVTVIATDKPNDEQIVDNFQVTFGENGDVTQSFFELWAECDSVMYDQAYVDEHYGSCVSLVYDAPLNELKWSCGGMGGFDLEYYYETKDLGFEKFINIFASTTFYPSCCGNKEGACEENGFDPTPKEEAQVYQMSLAGANDQGFAVERGNLYYVFML